MIEFFAIAQPPLQIMAFTLFGYHGLLLFWRRGRTHVGYMGGLFLMCSAGYAICTLTHHRPQYELLHRVVLPLCIAGPFFFWQFAQALFDDDYRPRAWQFALLAFVLLTSLAKHFGVFAELLAISSGDPLWRAVDTVFPQAFSLLFIGHSLFVAYSGHEGDLIENRRMLRALFILVVGFYSVLVLISEIALADFERAPVVLETLHFAVLIGFNLYFGLRSLHLNFEEPTTAHPESAPGPSPSRAGERTATAIDEELHAALTKRMEVDEIFREDGLTIRVLAASMRVQEYRLRRLINQGLGYRNFNEFLNRYRISAARRILGDSTQAEIPVIRVAMDLGFGSIAPFNRAFKRITGETPTEFRRQAADSQRRPGP